MRLKVPIEILQRCADPHRAKAYLEQLQDFPAAPALRKLSAEQARVLTALLSGSQFAADLLLAHPDWLAPLLEVDVLRFPRRDQGLRRDVNHWLDPLLKADGYEAAWNRLRQFRQREMVRIAARDLARLGTMAEITREISDVADVILQAVYRLCYEPLARRLGSPWHLDAVEQWRKTGFCIIGLGKLGGQELNYSSDIDVLFVYDDEGSLFKSPPRPKEQTGKGLPSHRFFARLAETMVAEISRLTPDGALFRIDLRLRPEGKAGPLARSLASFENYYSQWGQTWERMMLIKARPVAGDLMLGAEFIEMTQSFRYPRSLSQHVLREVAIVKSRIEKEVVRQGEIERNVKLGRGGIREIEFVAQTLQLLHAGRAPFLQGTSTLPVLQRLVKYSFLPAADALALEEAYVFLRDVEHRLQMEAGRQTHTIPTERHSRERLAALMGAANLAEFESEHARHARQVRRIFDRLLAGEDPEKAASLPPSDMEEARALWRQLLAGHGFTDPDRAAQMVDQFLNGPGYSHVSARTVELARELFPRLLALCPRPSAISRPDRILSDPDRVLVRLGTFIDAYGARAMLYELWARHPALFELLLLLFDRSEYLAERAISTPDLVDDLEMSGRLNRSKTAAETLADLRHGARDKDQRLWLRRYFQAELLRLGLRDILGLADLERNLVELSNLADACLQYALEVLMRRYHFKTAPFCVIGLGKLGGQELNYGSDLDLLFIADSGARNLPQCQRMAGELMEMLSASNEAGMTFRTDARLRPDGEKGLLVPTLDACQEYYKKRAALWEIQALTRVRPIAGDLETGGRFQELAAALTDFRVAPPIPAWKSEIAKMRGRTVRERTPAGQEALAIKTGLGGLMDAEFLAQAFCLERGWQEPNTLRALRRGREAGLPGCAPEDALLESYSQLRRIEGILRRWSFEGETMLPADAAALRRVAVRCGFAGAEEFAQAVAGIRSAIHAAWLKYFPNRDTIS